MSQELTKTNGSLQYNLGQDEIKTLVQSGIIPQGTPEGTIKMFARFCGESNLSPFKKQVHLVKRGEKFTIQTGIDGYRAIANRTGLYAGSDDYLFDEGIGEYEMIKNARKNPTTAKAVVYRLVGGVRCPFSATAGWKEYSQSYNGKLGNMWEKMPFLMLGKCAEALALRKAFPEELGGLYTDEEMAQATTFEEVQQKPEVHRQTVESNGHSVSYKEFDCKTERITFGKYSGVEWITLDKGYLEWIVKNGQPDARMKAEATLKYMDGVESQTAAVDDFAEVFGPDNKKAVVVEAVVEEMKAPAIDIVLSKLDDVIRKGDLQELLKWWKDNYDAVYSLPAMDKKIVEKAFNTAKKSLEKGSK